MINLALANELGRGEPGSGSHVPNRGMWNAATATAAPAVSSLTWPPARTEAATAAAAVAAVFTP